MRYTLLLFSLLFVCNLSQAGEIDYSETNTRLRAAAFSPKRERSAASVPSSDFTFQPRALTGAVIAPPWARGVPLPCHVHRAPVYALPLTFSMPLSPLNPLASSIGPVGPSDRFAHPFMRSHPIPPSSDSFSPFLRGGRASSARQGEHVSSASSSLEQAQDLSPQGQSFWRSKDASQKELRNKEDEQKRQAPPREKPRPEQIIKEEKKLLEESLRQNPGKFESIVLPLSYDWNNKAINIPEGDEALLKAREYKKTFRDYASNPAENLTLYTEQHYYLMHMVLSGRAALEAHPNETENITIMKLVNKCAANTKDNKYRKGALFIRGQIYEKGLLGQNKNLDKAIKDYRAAVRSGSIEAREKMVKLYGNLENTHEQIKYVLSSLKVLKNKYSALNRPGDVQRIKNEKARLETLLKTKVRRARERYEEEMDLKRLRSPSHQLSPQALYEKFIESFNRSQVIDQGTLYTNALNALNANPFRYHRIIEMLLKRPNTYKMGFYLAKEGVEKKLLPAIECLASLKHRQEKHFVKAIRMYEKAMSNGSLFAAKELFLLFAEGAKEEDVMVAKNPKKANDYLIKFLTCTGESLDAKHSYNITMLRKSLSKDSSFVEKLFKAIREKPEEINQKVGARYLAYFYHAVNLVRDGTDFTVSEKALMDQHPFPKERIQDFLKNPEDRKSAREDSHASEPGKKGPFVNKEGRASTAVLPRAAASAFIPIVRGNERPSEDTEARKRQRIEKPKPVLMSVDTDSKGNEK